MAALTSASLVVLFTCSWIFVLGQDLNVVRVEPGDDVTLPCQAADGSIRAVEWTKQGLEDYVLLYRGGRSDPTHQDPSFKGRVQLVDSELKDGDVSLTLRNVRNNDGGTYECGVASGGSRRKRAVEPIRSITLVVAENTVILQSPVPPVTEGDDVTLHCKPKPPSSDLPAAFYKDGSLIRTEPAGHMTIRNFSKSDEGAYKCHINGRGESPPSWLLIKDGSEPASLTVARNSSQLFEYQTLSLSCGDNSGVHEWKVIRSTTSGGKLSSCGDEWGTPTHFGCNIRAAKKPDSAVYWCESPARQRSNSVNIIVHDGPVILQSPVPPVMEGDDVTLRCETKDPPSNLSAAFYKDGSLIRNETAGHMTIHHVSKSDEGLYRCHISGLGESPPSWLFVRGRNLPVSTTTSPPSEDDEGLDRPYDDVTADVPTEHHF